MPDQGVFALLRGQINLTEAFQSPRGGPREPSVLPDRDPEAHRRDILAQLDRIWEAMTRREWGTRDPAAVRELLVLRPEDNSELTAESFEDPRYGVRVVDVNPATGAVLLDAEQPGLPHVRSKLERYVDQTLVDAETGARRNENAIAPLREVRLATPEDLAGARVLRAIREGVLVETDLRWFELSCRGGHRDRALLIETTRQQLARVLARLRRPPPKEFLAPERLLAFVRLTLGELYELVASTDCIYEFDLAGPPIRDWLMFNDPDFPVRELRGFRLTSPPQDAPSIVLLDTGVSSGHPMIGQAILTTSSVVPADASPEDVHGHGTLMAGVLLYEDVGAVVDRMAGAPRHWLENVKLLTRDGQGSASEEEREFWPLLMQNAFQATGPQRRNRVYAMAVTARLDDPPAATSWSQAIDQLAYSEGRGNLICVSIGNADLFDSRLAEGYPILNLDERLNDPSQAVNAVTIGAFTTKVVLPPSRDVGGMACLAPRGGVAPSTRAGVIGAPIKPEVVLEGGNAAWDGSATYHDIETLSSLTTHREFLRTPLGLISQTSGATAEAARLAASVWRAYPEYRPETVRALIIHSSSWTAAMQEQFPNLDERLAMCGYGVPDVEFAIGCTRDRATVVVEDSMPNAVLEMNPSHPGHFAKRRVIKYFRFPIPEEVMLSGTVEVAQARITLSYFGEPSTSRRRERRGLDLAFDLQGPQENEDQFRARMNRLLRPRQPLMSEGLAGAPEGTQPEAGGEGAQELRDASDRQRPVAGFGRYWAIGPLRRGRGTVQSDRLVVPISYLAGPKLIAVYPVLGWWDDRRDTELEQMRFSLVVSLEASGLEVYTAIREALEVEVPTVTIDIGVEVDLDR